MITLTYKSVFISDETGYSAWVMVKNSKDRKGGYAEQCGYFSIQKFANAHAERRAHRLQRVLKLAKQLATVERGVDE